MDNSQLISEKSTWVLKLLMDKFVLLLTREAQHISFFKFQLLSKSKSLDWKKMLRLQDVQASLGVSLEEMLTIVEEVLHPEPYSTEEICKCLGISLEDLRSQILSQNTQNGKHIWNTGFLLYSVCVT